MRLLESMITARLKLHWNKTFEQPFRDILHSAMSQLSFIILFKVDNRNTRKRNMFKINNKNTRTTSMMSFLCFFVNFEDTSHLSLVFLLLTLKK